MNISRQVLSRYIDLPSERRALRLLLDDVGIEVKRTELVDNDEIITVELLANRGDHHSYSGVARELSGRTGSPLCFPDYRELDIGQDAPKVSIETDLCLLYTATLLEKNTDAFLTPEDLKPLHAAGIHSLLPPIDATNLSNIEIGQPTHVFDADKIVGAITVRAAKEGETAWPLFAEAKVKVPAGACVIADDEKILAIAGVIGCEESKTTAETTRIILESACFDPVSVRKTARKLNIHTDSVTRFERGSDPSLPLIGAGRVCKLLSSGWTVVGDTACVGSWTNPQRKITLSVTDISAFLEVDIEEAEIMARLKRYGFGIKSELEGLSVTVPPHRLWDVDKRADLYEELAKSIGYNNTPSSLPLIDKGAEPSLSEKRRMQVEEILLGMGFYEVITNGFYSRAQVDSYGSMGSHVETLNALDRGYSLLKNNAFIHAVDGCVRNLHRQHSDLKMYEWTRTFHLDEKAANGVCRERKLLWAMCSGSERGANWAEKGRAADSLFLKGLVAEIATALRLPFVLKSPSTGPLASVLHPYRQADVLLNGKVVGVLGEIHPQIRLDNKLKKARPCYIEIEENAFHASANPIAYVPPPLHLPLVRTISFALPNQVEAQAVADVLRTSGATVSVADRFDFDHNEQPYRSITYQLRFPNLDGTRSADSVNLLLNRLIENVSVEFASAGVFQR